jgi:hypothetical protein
MQFEGSSWTSPKHGPNSKRRDPGQIARGGSIVSASRRSFAISTDLNEAGSAAETGKIHPVGVELPATSPEICQVSEGGGAEAGAVTGGSRSPVLALLLKLTDGLTSNERAALARLLNEQVPHDLDT